MKMELYQTEAILALNGMRPGAIESASHYEHNKNATDFTYYVYWKSVQSVIANAPFVVFWAS
jgi:hypothetical protein